MPGAGAGFLAGLASGFGDSLARAEDEKHKEKLARQKELSDLYINGIFSGTIRPETGYTEFAKIVTPMLTGDDSGKGKGKGLFWKFFKEPENLGKLMAGLHEGLGIVPPFAGTKPDTSAPTSESEDGELPSKSSAVQSRGSTPPGLAGILVSPEERQQQQIALKEGEAEAGALGADRGRMRAAEDLARRYKIPISEAMERVGLKTPLTATPREGTLGASILDAVEDFKAQNNREPTAAERNQIRNAVIKQQADARRAPQQDKPPSGAEGARVQRELGKIGKTWQTASSTERDVALRTSAMALEREDRAKFESLIDKRLVDIERDQAQLDAFKRTAPLTLQMKELQVQLDEKKLQTSLSAKGGPNPASILQSARKFAHTAVQQREKNKGWWDRMKSTIGFGDTDPTEDQLVDQFVQEWTGKDADTLRSEAAERYTPPKVGGATETASPYYKNDKGQWVIRQSGG